MTINLIPLAVGSVKTGAPSFIKNGPKGTRILVDVSEGHWEGERLRATQKGIAAGDWAHMDEQGIVSVDVRMLLETHDGALIYVNYQGRVDASKQGNAPIWIAPTFETGDSRYTWLNKIQAVGKGHKDLESGKLIYELFELA
ncbi:DUF3237 domain-containing protein [Pseudomonas silvicola]|nr:DUF3237 domain-containing protein [Pseudomonas silvicola]